MCWALSDPAETARDELSTCHGNVTKPLGKVLNIKDLLKDINLSLHFQYLINQHKN